MRVLVTWGSKLGGTAGIAEMIGSELRSLGIDVVTVPASRAWSPVVFDAVIVGGALYANRWHRDARRYVEQYARELSRVPTWLFSSGPLDDSADREPQDPPRPVQALAARIGALGHVTFGGRLDEHAPGLVAGAMAKKVHGDWRNPERIRAWAREIAAALPAARPRPAVVPAGRSPVRAIEYGAVAWSLPAALFVLVALLGPLWLALLVHGIAMPVWFALLAGRYQQALGARAPIPVALLWTAMTGILYLFLLTAPLGDHGLQLPTSLFGLWIPLALAFLASWAAGAISAMVPIRLPPPAAQHSH
jgi:menaquinone-dependent protoporphyrinogen oxidase